ncbi:hypothetical protein K450DRAFT_202597 [Umbelopsis ramanniana AG]|uniref:Uncharacterized protein n=1 Tax=Umbelopsis ramanniana AG TaxID=1314678 RepID=A0AAD5E3I2_UMBRA|nr:uncharacterized protein K450DRAFT_202597 [Umbelopsis ramanniana AG]KAI8575786.1 hypothetical protein K450DRAFT_202597 [Umbelopsis ramanniana AG]
MRCVYDNCSYNRFGYRNNRSLRRHIRDVHGYAIVTSIDIKLYQDTNDTCVYPLCRYNTGDQEAYKEHLVNVHNFPISLGNQPSELPGVGEQPSAQEDITAELLASSPLTATEEPSASSSVMTGPSASAPVIVEPSTSAPVLAEPSTSAPVIVEPSTSAPVIAELLSSALVTEELSASVPVIAEPSASGDIVVEPETASSPMEYSSVSGVVIEEPAASSSLIEQQPASQSTYLEPLNTAAYQKRRFSDMTDNSPSQRKSRRSQGPVTPRLSRNKGKQTAIPLWSENVRSMNKPNLRRAEADALESLVLFGISGSVSEEMEEKLASNRENSRTRLSLKAIPSAIEFLNRVLEAKTPSEAHARCAENIDSSTYHGQFLAIMQATLQDFCAVRRNQPSFKYTDNHERTFWINSVIPMFRYFGFLTDLASFKW